MFIKRNNGFTLIEVMIVIAIIGILASIVIPVMGGCTGKESVQECDEKVEQQKRASSVETK